MIPPIADLNHILFDESKCIDFLMENKIIYSKMTCSVCKNAMKIENKRWRCNKRKCRYSKSIFHESLFARAKIGANQVMLLAYFWLAGDSHQTIMNKTKHSQRTVTNFLNDFRDLVSSDLKEQKQKIGGDGIIIEIDESKFGKRKYHKGHSVEGVWVFGGVERTPKHKMFAVSVPNRSGETLLKIIEENILPGSIIYSDCWAGYNEIQNRLPMVHWTVNHSKNFKDPDTGVHTNTIEGTWHGLKIKISNRNRTASDIDKHLFEAIWRRNNSSNLWTAFILCLVNTSYK
jgi:hypothetical protein